MHGVARAAHSHPLAIVAAPFRHLPDFRFDIFLDEGIDVTDDVPPL